MPVRTRLLALLVAAALWSTVLASAVAAAEIPRLQGPVTDRVGALDGRAGEVEDAIDELLAAENVQLFVAFVSTTDDLTVTEFVDETARQNSLGANDVLLVVALDDRTDAIWVADGLDRITDREIDAIIADTLEPRLRDGDFAGAAVATARALGDAAAVGPVTPVPTQRPSDGGGTGGGGGIGLGAVIAIILVAIGIFVVGRWVLAMFANRREAEERDRRTGRLAREANALLLSTDERIRDAQQEVGFVEAAYGEREVVPLREAITAAQAELRAAFEIRQRLDDDEPEDPPTREAMLTEIVERTRGAQAALDRENERIRQLRDLERDAPAILEALPERIEAVEARLDGAERTLAGLQRYAESTWRPVGGNLVEARKGLEGARAAVRDGLAALEAGTPSVAARHVRTAQEGESGAGALIDAIDKLAQSAREAEARLPEELRSAETDLGEARQALDRANGDATLRERLGQAETSLRTAQAAATASPLDPVSALRAAVEAHRQADEVLAAVRQDAEQRAKFLAALEASFTTARADIDRAADFIAARRGGVGRRARTRLTEAERQLDHALSLRDADPQAAMAAARRAEQLAEEAYRLATQDFDDWSGGGPGSGPRRRSDTELVLGGILGGILLGGGRGGGGGWGGSPWGTPGPFGGGGGWGGGGGGRSRGGGFGGFGGGGLGGGGGRSRGGRW